RALELRRQVIQAADARFPMSGASWQRQIDWWVRDLLIQAEYEHKLERDEEALATRYRAREAWNQVKEQPSLTAEQRDIAIRNFTGFIPELGFLGRLADGYTMAAEARELAGGRPKVLLNLSFALERSIRAATRGAAQDYQPTAEVEHCLDLAIAMFQEGARGAPDQVESLLKTQPIMRNYQALMSLDADIEKNADNVEA